MIRPLALSLLAGCAAAPDAAPDGGAWPIVFAEDFAAPGSAARFACSDPTMWRWSDEGDAPSLELLGKSRYEPPVRSPTSIALAADGEVADFDLDVDVLQTGRDYGHRDLCLFFGFESPQHFYYVHLATTPDPNAHNVFRVDAAPRTNLAPVAAAGVDWGRDVWHHVRIERRVAAGTIRVFWDGAAEPVLAATCTRFAWGRIGVGSFDDSGRFRNLVVRAPRSRSVAGPGDPFARGRVPTDAREGTAARQ